MSKQKNCKCKKDDIIRGQKALKNEIKQLKIDQKENSNIIKRQAADINSLH